MNDSMAHLRLIKLIATPYLPLGVFFQNISPATHLPEVLSDNILRMGFYRSHANWVWVGF